MKLWRKKPKDDDEPLREKVITYGVTGLSVVLAYVLPYMLNGHSPTGWTWFILANVFGYSSVGFWNWGLPALKRKRRARRRARNAKNRAARKALENK